MKKNIDEINLWTAIITPMLENGEVDLESFEKLCKEQEEAGNGILILGSTGESLNLDEADKKNILHFTLELNLNVPIMVGVGGINLNKTSDWVSYLESHPIDAYLFVTPLYAKPGPVGQYQWFKSLMDEVTKPVILYNVPSRTGKALALEAVEKLKDHKNFYGVKEASGSVEDLKQYIKASGNGKKVFCGDDGLMPDFADAGACGLISVASNVWPKETALYVEQCLASKMEDKALWQKCADTLFEVANPIPAKALLHTLNRIQTPTLRPPLTHEELNSTDNQCSANADILVWYTKHKG